MDYRKLVGLPVSEVSIVFIGLILMFLNLLTKTQELAMYLFVTLPIIIEFGLWLGDKTSLRKYVHIPVIVFLMSYSLFLGMNILFERITTFSEVLSTFIDFLLALFISFSSFLIVRSLMSVFFPTEDILSVKHKKIKVLFILFVAIVVPISIFYIFTLMNPMRLKK